MSDGNRQIAVDKLLILYFIENMEANATSNQLIQFILEKEYMDYFTIQQYLSELVEIGYITKSKAQHGSLYSVTEDGYTAIGHLIELLPQKIISEIRQYSIDKKSDMRKGNDIAANYFQNSESEFVVKCGAYERDGTVLAELVVTVVSKDVARLICKNWRQNASSLYKTIFNAVTENKPESDLEPTSDFQNLSIAKVEN